MLGNVTGNPYLIRKLVGLSRHGRQIVVPNANHGAIPREVIINAIREVVTEARGVDTSH